MGSSCGRVPAMGRGPAGAKGARRGARGGEGPWGVEAGKGQAREGEGQGQGQEGRAGPGGGGPREGGAGRGRGRAGRGAGPGERPGLHPGRARGLADLWAGARGSLLVPGHLESGPEKLRTPSRSAPRPSCLQTPAATCDPAGPDGWPPLRAGGPPPRLAICGPGPGGWASVSPGSAQGDFWKSTPRPGTLSQSEGQTSVSPKTSDSVEPSPVPSSCPQRPSQPNLR